MARLRFAFSFTVNVAGIGLRYRDQSQLLPVRREVLSTSGVLRRMRSTSPRPGWSRSMSCPLA